MGMEGNYPTGVNDNVIHQHFGSDEDEDQRSFEEVVGELTRSMDACLKLVKEHKVTGPKPVRKALLDVMRKLEAVKNWTEYDPDEDGAPLHDTREERDA